MSKLKTLITNPRIIILLVCILLAIVAISPNPWSKGIAIKAIAKNSTASLAGIPVPSPSTQPVGLERITEINGQSVTTEKEYMDAISAIPANTSFILTTTKNKYRLTTEPLIKITVLNETELVTVTQEVLNTTTNLTQNITTTQLRNKTISEVIGVKDIGIRVAPAAQNNIRKGLELSGGTRVLLKPAEKISDKDLDLLLENMKQRLNVFGLSDVVIRTTKDLNGDTFILVEIAGANVEEVKDLLARQGKFEAKIGNNTVFKGGQDIVNVCRSADCSGLDSSRGCRLDATGAYGCGFRFAISLSEDAAKRQAELTKNLPVEFQSGEGYLNESLDLYLDDELVDTLRISDGLKGKAVKEISISGGGSGKDQGAAVLDALSNMKRLQTILITGSLPVKLEIVKTDSITPLLGKEFLDNLLLVGLIALIAVSLVIYVRYRKIVVAIPVVITLLAEIVILMGAAALIKWNLDLVSIAGILVAIGTGVDSQVIIVDEILRKEVQSFTNWKDRIKNALFIIMASYFTLVVAMIPLFTAGAGMLKGFALTTIIGISIGVFITRPAFAKIAEVLLKEE